MSFLIEESTSEKIPKLLEDIIKQIYQNKEQDILRKDLFCVLIVVLMIENGMKLVNKNFDIIDLLISFDTEQLSQWKSPVGLYETIFVMCCFRDIKVKLIISPLGGISVINAIINVPNSETYTVCLPVSRYVVSPLATNIPMKFRDLKHLSMMFKNNIICPVKSRILSFYGYASASLIGIPDEILYKIMLLMPVKDILNTCRICTRLKCLLYNGTLWHSLFRRDFNSEVQNCITEWKELYKDAYVTKQEHRLSSSARTSGTMHDYMDYSDYVSYIDNPMWDMII